MDIGKILSERRQEKSLTIQEVVKAIKIRGVYIQALEANNFQELPGGIYTEGYLRLYAEYLEADANALTETYRNSISNQIPVEENSTNSVNETPNYSDTTPSKLLLIFCLALITILVVIKNYNSHKEANKVKEAQTLAERLNEIIASDDKAITVLSNAQSLVTIFDSSKISQLDGNAEIIFSSIMKAGDNYSFVIENGSSPVIQTEDISKLDIFLDGYLVGDINNLEVNDKGVVLDVNKLLSNIELD